MRQGAARLLLLLQLAMEVIVRLSCCVYVQIHHMCQLIGCNSCTPVSGCAGCC